jgi:hypothetical protein
LLELARAETRQRTAALFDLPPDEDVEVRLTNNQPWGAYNWYLGNGRSLIEFNTDIPVSALGLIGTFAHEGYPGHHTESLRKEKHLYRAKGYGEQAAMLLHSPAAGITPDMTAGEMRRMAAASRRLRYVSGNAAVLHHSGRLNRQQTIDYIQTYGLSTAERAEKSFSFLTHPLFRSYTFTYTQGHDLIAKAAKDGSKQAIFGRLLSGQILPSQLESDA